MGALLSVLVYYKVLYLVDTQIGFKMYGVKGKSLKETQSQSRRLWDPDVDRFSAGGEDSFIITTPASLGRLTHVDIWHDHTGASPDW